MAQSKLSLPDSGDLHLVSGPRTTPTVFVVDWHATGLALAGVVLAVDACSCGWIWRRSSTRGSHRALRRPLHALPATGIAPQLPPSAPSEAEVCTGRVGGKSASGVEDRHAHPSVLHQICTPLWKPRSDSERTPETVSVRSSTRRRTRNPVRRGVHSRRLPPPHHGRTGRQTRCGGTL